MNRNAIFISLTGLGILFCLGVVYYIFFYPPSELRGPLGIVYNPVHENYSRRQYNTDITNLTKGGMSVLQLSAQWGEIEQSKGNYYWSILDKEINFFSKQGWRISVNVPIIDGYAFSKFPQDIQHSVFNDGEYRQRVKDFLLALVKRYDKKINYLEIGNEVDRYLIEHRGDISAYVDFYNYLYQEVKKEKPELLISTVFSYDNLVNSGNLDFFFNQAGFQQDFIGLTYYNIDDSFNIMDTSEIDAALSDIVSRANGRNIALVRTGLSVSEELGSGDEQQELFIEKLLKFITDNRSTIVFVNYDNFRDLSEGHCLQLAEKQLWSRLRYSEQCLLLAEQGKACSKQMLSQREVNRLADFYCSLGLKDRNDLPRSSWNRLLEQVKEYNFNET